MVWVHVFWLGWCWCAAWVRLSDVVCFSCVWGSGVVFDLGDVRCERSTEWGAVNVAVCWDVSWVFVTGNA